MREIERQMVNAIKQGRNWSNANTRVAIDQMGSGYIARVYLHENLIAQIGTHTDEISVTFAGWPTATTRSRINALLHEFTGGRYGVSIRLGVPQWHTRDKGYFERTPITSTVWVERRMAGTEFNAATRKWLKEQREQCDRDAAQAQAEIAAGTREPYVGASYGDV